MYVSLKYREKIPSYGPAVTMSHPDLIMSIHGFIRANPGDAIPVMKSALLKSAIIDGYFNYMSFISLLVI